MKNIIARFIREEDGQDLIEYVLLGSFISLAAVAGATLIGTNLQTWYDKVGLWVGGAASQVPAPPTP